MVNPLLNLRDCHSVVQAVFKRANRYPNDIAVEKPSNLGARWQRVTAQEFKKQIEAHAKGFIGMGLKVGETVSILGSTSYDWCLLDLAAQAAGLITVPIYESDSEDQIAWILKDSQVRAVITDTVVQSRMVRSIVRENQLDNCHFIFTLDDGAKEDILEHGLGISSEELDERVNAARIDDVFTIVYTSGTTGRPKGVEITNANFVVPMDAVMHGCWQEWIYDPGCRVMLFLPLAHVLARFISYQMLVGRGTAAYVPSVKNLINDLQQFRPKALLVVPRVLEKIYNAADAKAGHGLKLKLFRWCARTGEHWGMLQEELQSKKGIKPKIGMWQKAQIKLARKLVLSKIINLMGGNVTAIVSGGAPLANRLTYFFGGCGIEVLQGYGLTETAGPLCMSIRDANAVGSVGPALKCNKIRVDENGEIQAKGASIMRGYHNNPEATAAAFSPDGWLCTGDLGHIDEMGRLYITGRKKEIIVTAGGKNVSPSLLEERLKGHPLVSQVLVVGDQKPFVAALVTLDKDMLPLWLKNHGLPDMNITEAARHELVLEALEKAVKRTNKVVSRAESIRKIKILTTDFTVENGLLTPSLKLRREIVMKKYASTIEGLYNDVSSVK